MTRISRTSQGNRIRENYIRQMTNTENLPFVEKVQRIEKPPAASNYHSDSYLMSYDRYYESIIELKETFKRLYYFSKETPFSEQEHKDQLLEQIAQLVQKYNETVMALTEFEVFSQLSHVHSFHEIFTRYTRQFELIGITENEDFTLSFNPARFLDWYEEPDQAILGFIRQFKLALMKEYQSVFKQTDSVESFALKGLIIEEKR